MTIKYLICLMMLFAVGFQSANAAVRIKPKPEAFDSVAQENLQKKYEQRMGPGYEVDRDSPMIYRESKTDFQRKKNGK
jgi:hypothetical protein